MRRLPFASLFVLATIAGAAELVPPVTRGTISSDDSLAVSSDTDVSQSKGKRLVSPDTAAKLAAAAPKFVAPAEESAPAVASEPSPVLREVTKPRNQIIRLPRFVVEEPKLRLPKDLQVLTPKGRVDYAFARRPGLRFGPFAALNSWIAVEMLEDDLLARRRVEEAELWSLYLIRDIPSISLARAQGPGER